METLAVLIGLTILAVPFIMPIVSWVVARRTRDRVDELERKLAEAEGEIRALTNRVKLLHTSAPSAATAAAPAPAVRRSEPVVAREPVRTADPAAPGTPPPIAPPREPITPAAREPITPAAREPIVPATPEPIRPAAPAPATTPQQIPAPARDTIVPPAPRPPVGPPSVERPAAARSAQPPRPPIEPPPPPPPPPPSGPIFELPAFDWEQLVGVRLFSAIAGIALVFAGVFFLRYSIEHGWLQPPVRVVIGILTGIGLLVVCERKAARNYPITANALDAAAIALLFSTFFAAHSQWDLISAGVAFAMLAIVTATAVLLSIRRESLFIAVLGLLGGFATPMLLSSGENRPIGLFSYLLLLNIGLGWVAYRQRWQILTILTLVLTTLYQWGWVIRFLDASQLPLAVGIFIVFAVVGFGALILSTGSVQDAADDEPMLRQLKLAATAMPLFFAVYLAAVPEYRDNYWLLFGFLLLVDAGLLAITIARGEALMHVAGAALTLLTFGVWLAVSYSSAAWPAILGIVSVFVLLYLFAPDIARRFDRAFDPLAARSVYAAPMLLFVFASLVRIERATESPALIFAPLLALLVVIAWRAMMRDAGALYYTAAFFTLVAEAVWSARHLRLERLMEAIVLYAAFGIMYLAVPIVARRIGRALQPEGAGGVVVLASLGLLLYLAGGDLAGPAIWGLALLLAILNAGVFIESASARLPALSLIATAGSWIVLGLWWSRAAGEVGLLASLLVLVGLTLLMMGGYAWARHESGDAQQEPGVGFQFGFYLALVGHLFLFALAMQVRWSIPPWPIFGALTVITLALLATALAFRDGLLHGSGLIAAAVVIFAFAGAAEFAPWPSVAVAAFIVLAAVGLSWIPVAGRAGYREVAAIAAAVVLFTGIFGAIVADAQPGAPALWLLTPWHVAALSTVLFLSVRYGWNYVAPGVAIVAGLIGAAWQASHRGPETWASLLILTGALYGVFVLYPLILGRRGRESRDPYIAAIIASAWAFFLARQAFERGGLESIIGIVPVTLGAVMAVHLRQLLRIEAAGERDLGRLALVAAAGLGFVTVAIPLQLEEQWITIGWALEGAALAWLYGRIPHRGLLFGTAALLAAVFVRLALNPEVFLYEPRGAVRILNWYLYTYLLAAAAMFVAAWWLTKTDDSIDDRMPRLSYLVSAGGAILLFLLLNIEIADFYATGPEIVFRFGVSIEQDLTYTIGWLIFGLGMLAAGIMMHSRAARIASVALIAVTTFKCFLYDLRSLGGLYRVAAFVGLAISLTLVSLALQKFVLKPQGKVA